MMESMSKNPHRVLKENLSSKLEKNEKDEILADDAKFQMYKKNTEKVQKKLVIIFRFLQLLCHGQNPKLQRLLRTQSGCGFGETKSINLVQVSGTFFGDYIKYVNVGTMDLGVFVINFLIDAVQGPCYENASALLQMNIVQTIQTFLQDWNKPFTLRQRGYDTRLPFEDEYNKQKIIRRLKF